MKKIFFSACSAVLLLSCSSSATKEESTTPTETAAPAEKKDMPAEFADEKYVEIGKQGLANLSSGDVDSWMNAFADNATYRWNTGDSLIGKPAIAAYWKKRRGEEIDSLTFNTPVYLAVKVNKSQQPTQTEGVWLLNWYAVEAKYKTSGKKMRQWVHTLMHFDANDKVDQVIQFIDRGAIAVAEKKK